MVAKGGWGRRSRVGERSQPDAELGAARDGGGGFGVDRVRSRVGLGLNPGPHLPAQQPDFGRSHRRRGGLRTREPGAPSRRRWRGKSDGGVETQPQGCAVEKPDLDAIRVPGFEAVAEVNGGGGSRDARRSAVAAMQGRLADDGGEFADDDRPGERRAQEEQDGGEHGDRGQGGRSQPGHGEAGEQSRQPVTPMPPPGPSGDRVARGWDGAPTGGLRPGHRHGAARARSSTAASTEALSRAFRVTGARATRRSRSSRR